uniref:Uncharacterized protein n=1 Tax=Tanacetum cinerariifolium TaxID=118510 RepID=A0A699SXS3_TANCI|nr:hypothetical protein [Tanacetum cinerariifolium]
MEGSIKGVHDIKSCVPEIEAMKPYMTVTAPMFGVIYDNANLEKRFMAMDEVMKFLTGTLEGLAQEFDRG